MSGPSELNKPNDASTLSRLAANWVSAHRGGKDWSGDQQAELDAWLAQSLAHRVAYLRIDAAWQRAERLAALKAPMRPISSAGQSHSPVWRRLAAGLALLVPFGILASQFYPASNGQLIETPKGGQERVTLADGSQIELNTDTAVRVDYRPGSRAIELVRGEAYFEVRHDASRPFAVTAGKRRIVDLGTKFVVRMLPEELKVSLLEGKASLESDIANHQRSMLLAPGDVVVATADSLRVSKASTRQLADDSAWRHGSVVFHYKRLDAAVAELNRYGGPQIVVADTAAAKLLISGTFLTNRPEDFAGVTHEIFGLHVQHRDGKLILSR